MAFIYFFVYAIPEEIFFSRLNGLKIFFIQQHQYFRTNRLDFDFSQPYLDLFFAHPYFRGAFECQRYFLLLEFFIYHSEITLFFALLAQLSMY